MQYHSTRGGSGQLDSAAAVLQGLAQDGGLFLPVEIPAFDWGTCLTCDTKKMAEKILSAFLPDIPQEALLAELLRRRGSELTAEDLLTGILHNRLGRVLTKSVGIRGVDPIEELSEEDLEAVARRVKAFTVPLSEPLGMDSAQVTAGGILTSEFDPKTMESKLQPGLYACGEVLDIDGDCGGYNLQWAWSSGRLAGLSAGKESV